MTTPRVITCGIPRVPSSGTKPDASFQGTALNAALDFSKLQEAMVEGQSLSVSARAKLLESPFIKPEQKTNSVQKLVQQLGNIGIAPPRPQAQKTLNFETPIKAALVSEPRVALGELSNKRPIALAFNDDKNNREHDVENVFAPEVDKEPANEPLQEPANEPLQTAAALETLRTAVDHDAEKFEAQPSDGLPAEEQMVSKISTEDCADVVSALAADVDRVELIDVEKNVSRLSDASEGQAPQLLGHNFDAYIADFDVDVDAELGEPKAENANVSSTLEHVEISLHADIETSLPVTLEVSGVPCSDVDIQVDDVHKDQTSDPKLPEDDVQIAGLYVGRESVNELLLKTENDDSNIVLAPENETGPPTAASNQASLSDDLDEHLSDEVNTTINTVPPSEEIDESSISLSRITSANYDDAVDETNVAPGSIYTMNEIAVPMEHAQSEEVMEVGANNQSQAATVTKSVVEEEHQIQEEDTEASISGVQQLLGRESSPAPEDPLTKASNGTTRMSLEIVPSRRDSTPIEDIKHVVKSTVVGYCSEVQQENVILKDKIDALEQQIISTNKQLAITASQLAACATKDQITDLQELLREAAAAREKAEQRDATCRGCIIC